MFKIFAVVCLFGVAAGAPYYGGYAVDTYSEPRYNFNYAVNDPHTGDHKAQSEYREGGVVKGSYSLAEPDGTIRVVDYHADPHSGFNAVVKRIGAAAHPQYIAPVAPIAPAYSHASNLVGLGGWGSHGLGWGAGVGSWGAGVGSWGGHGLGWNAGWGLGGYH